MKKARHNNLASSVFVAGLILSRVFLLYSPDSVFQVLVFVILQMTMGSVCVLLILMRITSLFKNRGAWFYYFSGIFQVLLVISDLILWMTSHFVTKKGMICFIGLNTLFASVIGCDIYQFPLAKFGKRQ